MVTNETVDNLLNSETGVFAGIRDGRYERLTDETKSTILEFSRIVNSDLRQGKVNSNGLKMLIELLSLIHGIEEDTASASYLDAYNKFYADLCFELARGL